MRYRIITRLDRSSENSCILYLVQQRHLLFFWETIKTTESQDDAKRLYWSLKTLQISERNAKLYDYTPPPGGITILRPDQKLPRPSDCNPPMRRD